jgi:predicted RNase H-like nuclease (RuvC/YqgF family)
MTKLVRSLTATNGKAYGIVRAEQYDFEDDGSHFKGYEYKGMPLTQCVSKNYGTFLSIRVDYLRNNFTFKDWMATEEYKLEDEFNGCSQVDLDKLVENLDKIIAKVEELNNSVEVDIVAYDAKVREERANLNSLRDRFNGILSADKKIQWWELNDYKLKSASDYIKSEMRNLERDYSKLDNCMTLSIRDKREFLERGLCHSDFYISELEKMFGIN